MSAADPSYREFALLVMTWLGRETSWLPDASARLVDDLHLDQLELFTLYNAMDDAGASIPQDLMPYISTMDDLHYHYDVRT